MAFALFCLFFMYTNYNTANAVCLVSSFLKVMELLESKVGSGLFLEALTGVNMEISRKRVERKRQRAVEKATDPVAAGERRRERTEAGKVRVIFG